MHQLVGKLSHTERAAVAELKALLVQQYGVRDIRLFGSKARGIGHVESAMAFYTYSNEKYEPCFFNNGIFHGTPEEAFDIAAVYLQD